MEYSLPLPLSFHWSVFILQLLPHQYLSGPSTHFHHHSHGLSGDAYLAQRKYAITLKGLFLPYLNLLLTILHNTDKIIFWKIKSDHKNP